MDAPVESFYDTFASRLIEDYVHKNDRVQHRLRFLGCPPSPPIRSPRGMRVTISSGFGVLLSVVASHLRRIFSVISAAASLLGFLQTLAKCKGTPGMNANTDTDGTGEVLCGLDRGDRLHPFLCPKALCSHARREGAPLMSRLLRGH
jgi:hypothetical protein